MKKEVEALRDLHKPTKSTTPLGLSSLGIGAQRRNQMRNQMRKKRNRRLHQN